MSKAKGKPRGKQKEYKSDNLVMPKLTAGAQGAMCSLIRWMRSRP